MAAYYNEIDPYAAEWLRNLIRDGHIADGEVDTQSIEDIQPHDLRKFTQCHFFAGVGLWSLALRLAGWTDDRPIWTGSCPCQPFSAAGKGDGFDDERHLWPAFQYLASVERPGVICGEQVASKDGYAWLDLVSSDLENMEYAFWPVVFPAASVGAPNERHRTYWVGLADADGQRGGGRGVCGHGESSSASAGVAFERPARLCSASSVADRNSAGLGKLGAPYDHGGSVETRYDPARRGALDGVDYAERARLEGLAGDGSRADGRPGPGRSVAAPSVPDHVADPSSRGLGIVGRAAGAGRGGHIDVGGANASARPGPLNGFWANADWLGCTDERWRPVEPGAFPLAYGLPRSMGTVGPGLAGLYLAADVGRDTLDRAKRYRVGSLRGYGNAINPQQAAEFIASWMAVAP